MAKQAQRTKNEAIITGTAVVDNAAAPVPTNMGVAGFKIKKLVTVPSLVMKIAGEQRILRFDDAIAVSTVRDPKKPDEKPANVAHVTDMETGQIFVFLVPSVVQGNMEQHYVDGAYVGKIFLIKNLGKDPAKRYVNFGIAEVEADDAA